MLLLELILLSKETPRGEKRRKHHGRGKRDKTAAREAHKAPAEMCTKAMKMMDRIIMVLDKYESSESDYNIFLSSSFGKQFVIDYLHKEFVLEFKL